FFYNSLGDTSDLHSFPTDALPILLESMPQPVVAAVNGQAHGGGSELCWACTIRVVAESGHFGQPEVNVGIIPGAGGTQRLPRLRSEEHTSELQSRSDLVCRLLLEKKKKKSALPHRTTTTIFNIHHHNFNDIHINTTPHHCTSSLNQNPRHKRQIHITPA